VTTAQVVGPCLGEINDVKIGGANVDVKFKWLGSEISLKKNGKAIPVTDHGGP
jgi:hypothetical protein